MRLTYTNQGHSILGRRCLTMRGQPHDKTLAGERGEIWQCGETHCRAYIVQPSGSEKLYTFENKHLAKWILRLRVPADPADQLKWANCIR